MAPSAENLDAADRSVSYTCDSPVFMRFLLMHFDLSYGIPVSYTHLAFDKLNRTNISTQRDSEGEDRRIEPSGVARTTSVY